MIGINQQIETNSGANDGVGFAVPISAVKRSVAQLENGGKAEYAYIGVSSQALYPQLAAKLGLDTKLRRPARRSRPRRPRRQGRAEGRQRQGSTSRPRDYRAGGDVILAVDGRKVIRPDDLARISPRSSPGQKVTLDNPPRRANGRQVDGDARQAARKRTRPASASRLRHRPCL